MLILLLYIYIIHFLTYYISSIMYYINIVIKYNKRCTLIIILIIYTITKTKHMYPTEHIIHSQTPSAVCTSILRT